MMRRCLHEQPRIETRIIYEQPKPQSPGCAEIALTVMIGVVALMFMLIAR